MNEKLEDAADILYQVAEASDGEVKEKLNKIIEEIYSILDKFEYIADENE